MAIERRFTPESESLLATLERGKYTLRILYFLRDHSPASRVEMYHCMPKSGPHTLNRCISILEEADLIDREIVGRQKRYKLTPNGRIVATTPLTELFKFYDAHI